MGRILLGVNAATIDQEQQVPSHYLVSLLLTSQDKDGEKINTHISLTLGDLRKLQESLNNYIQQVDKEPLESSSSNWQNIYGN